MSKPICCIPECELSAWLVGRCSLHVKALKREHPDEFARLKAMSLNERDAEFRRTKNPPPPHWQYEGREDELAAMVEQQEQTQEPRQ
jgi:hypothetical protein